MGITRIADVTGLDVLGIPVCQAVRPNSRNLSVSQGKGLTLDLARVSAAMEACELFHAEDPALETLQASYRDLEGSRPTLNPTLFPMRVGSTYKHSQTLSWLEAYDLMSGEKTLVPRGTVACDFGLDRDLVSDPFHHTSKGLASGNHLVEALNHGLFELVERDALRLWQVLLRNPSYEIHCVDLASVDAPAAAMLIDRFRSAGFHVWVWSMCVDVAIPIFGAMITEERPNLSLEPLGAFQGYGAHLSKEVALIRALTEAAQSRLTYIAGARDDVFRSDYVTAQSGINSSYWKSRLAGSRAKLDFRSLPALQTGSFQGDHHVLLAMLKAAGFDSAPALNLSREDLGVAVVRVILPQGSWGLHQGVNHRLRACVVRHIHQQLKGPV